jgi:hypothetical protein
MTCPSVSFLNEVPVLGGRSSPASRQEGLCITVAPALNVGGSPSAVTVTLVNTGGIDAYSARIALYWQSDWGGGCVPINPNVVGQTNPCAATQVTATSPGVAFNVGWLPQAIDSGTLYVQAMTDPQLGCVGTPPAGTPPTDATQPYNCQLWCLIL